MQDRFNIKKCLLTHSCTGALEMAALLANIQVGDEVILPSYTFVSTANAFVLRGAIPIWCDIRKDSLNIDESKIEALITPKTKAIVVVHYAGVACEMDTIMEIAQAHHLLVIEDAAQGVDSTYKGKYLGTIGHLGCYSFHETKNFISGEGGALLVNDRAIEERAEIIREKGTNRSQFFRGEIDKYTWVDIGSSFLPSELVAAFLFAQLEHSEEITTQRLSIWNQYKRALQPLERDGLIMLPHIPNHCVHNAHMFYLLCKTATERSQLIAKLNDTGIKAVFHYVPLHSSPMGQRVQPAITKLPITDDVAAKLVRLPMYYEMSEAITSRVIKTVKSFFG